jgi:hypothetical protein
MPHVTVKNGRLESHQTSEWISLTLHAFAQEQYPPMQTNLEFSTYLSYAASRTRRRKISWQIRRLIP